MIAIKWKHLPIGNITEGDLLDAARHGRADFSGKRFSRKRAVSGLRAIRKLDPMKQKRPSVPKIAMRALD